MPPDRPHPPTQDAADLRAGIAAARAGERALARDLLTRVVQQDERNAQAWLWLSGVVDSLEDQEICLENVLTLDPENEAARRGLAALQGKKTSQAAAPAGTPPPAAAQAVVAAAPVGPAQPAAAEPPSPIAPFDEQYLCPYCAAPTHPQDRKCPACAGSLWHRSREQEEKSSRRAMALTLQAICAALNAAGVVVLLVYVSRKVEGYGLAALARLYLGLSGDIPPEAANAALALVPRPTFLVLVFLFVLSLVVLVGLYLRWKPAFFLFLVNGAGLTLAGVMITMLLWEAAGWDGPELTLAARVGLVLVDVSVALVMLGLSLEIRDDFFFEQQRILFRLDREAIAGMDFLVHGQRYIRLRMWALAALHLRRAVDQLPNDFEAQVKLALANAHLRRYEQASRALAEARRIRPDDPRAQELVDWLERRRAEDRQHAAGKG